MNKLARALRDRFGCPYTTALRLLREHGAEGATEILESRESCAHSALPIIDRATGDETCPDCGAENPR